MLHASEDLMFVMLTGSFFFSSRRRHTIYIGDWSSDVCSSDLDHIEIIASYEMVDAMGAHITHRGRQAGCDLALDVDIPLLDVISLRIRFDIRAGERASPQR